MPPTLIPIILSLVEAAIANEPAIAEALKSIFAKANPTPEDWQAVRTAALSSRYKDLVPHSQLP